MTDDKATYDTQLIASLADYSKNSREYDEKSLPENLQQKIEMV